MNYKNGLYDPDLAARMFPNDVERFRISFKFENGEVGTHYILSTSLKAATETMLRMIESWNKGVNLVSIEGRLG